MRVLRKNLFCVLILLFTTIQGNKSVTIKMFHVFENVSSETQELKNSIIINYNKMGTLSDSTIFNHTLPLSKKYVYVLGENEGLKLKRSYAREMVLSYYFKYNNHGQRISTELLGTGDTVYWKEFRKYNIEGQLIKQIRYNPSEAINPEMMVPKRESGKMVWGESYEYDSTGTVLEHKEIYNNYILVISSYDMQNPGNPKKNKEYFDPSVIIQTTFFHNDKGLLTHETSSGRLGKSLGSRSHEYDILDRRIKTKVYNSNGVIEETFNTVYDDEAFKTYYYYTDSTLKLSSMTEVLLDNKGRVYVEARLDGEERVLEKNVYYYDKKDRIALVKQYDMLRRGRKEDKQIPIKVNTYEYD